MGAAVFCFAMSARAFKMLEVSGAASAGVAEDGVAVVPFCCCD
jgi:hypothetical protein